MYLRALGAFPPLPITSSLLQVGDDPDECRAQGGIPSYRDEDHRLITNSIYSGRMVRIWSCKFPPARPVAPAPPPQPIIGPSVNVSVPTQVTTQVSPQISPVFVQQSNPKDSPVTATPVSAPGPIVPLQAPAPVGPSYSAPTTYNAPPPPAAPAPTRGGGGGSAAHAPTPAPAPSPNAGSSPSPGAPAPQAPPQSDPLADTLAKFGQQALERLLNQAAPPPPPAPGTSVAPPVGPTQAPAPAPAPAPIVMGSGGGGTSFFPVSSGSAAPLEAGMSKTAMILMALVAGGFLLTKLKGARHNSRAKR